MRPLVTITALLALALGAVSMAPAAGGPARMRIVDLAPVTVQGLRFAPGERVRVVLNADRRQVRTVRAGRAGLFSARFAFYADACTAFNLRATGASGAVARVTRKLPPQCAALDPVP